MGTPLGFTFDGRVLIARDHLFVIWDAAHGRRLTALNVPAAAAGGGPYGARPVALSRDGRTMATVTGDGTTLVVWDLDRDVQVASLPAPRGISSLAFGAELNTLAAGEGAGPIVVWDVSQAKKLAELPVDTLGGSIVTVAATSDGRTLASLQPAGQPQTASGCFGCEVILWDLDHRTRIAVLSGHTIQPDNLAFSPDGQTLVSTAESESILWSVPRRAPMVTLAAVNGPIIFSPDGHTLATAGPDDAVTLWDTDPASWQRTLCTIAGRDIAPSEWSAYLPETPYRPVCAELKRPAPLASTHRPESSPSP
ncbi:WD40 repeat domain-containing protein [Nonomuraea insulae]|uniref:WD40 repeat domain-containing protein n=1 Tax=Nonomuraea insulae TaxID=1616787 RepID=A0ABW1CHX4_9ACTN